METFNIIKIQLHLPRNSFTMKAKKEYGFSITTSKKGFCGIHSLMQLPMILMNVKKCAPNSSGVNL